MRAKFFFAAEPNKLAASRYATTVRSAKWYARLCRVEFPAAVSKISLPPPTDRWPPHAACPLRRAQSSRLDPRCPWVLRVTALSTRALIVRQPNRKFALRVTSPPNLGATRHVADPKPRAPARLSDYGRRHQWARPASRRTRCSAQIRRLEASSTSGSHPLAGQGALSVSNKSTVTGS